MNEINSFIERKVKTTMPREYQRSTERQLTDPELLNVNFVPGQSFTVPIFEVPNNDNESLKDRIQIRGFFPRRPHFQEVLELIELSNESIDEWLHDPKVRAVLLNLRVSVYFNPKAGLPAIENIPLVEDQNLYSEYLNYIEKDIKPYLMSQTRNEEQRKLLRLINQIENFTLDANEGDITLIAEYLYPDAKINFLSTPKDHCYLCVIAKNFGRLVSDQSPGASDFEITKDQIRDDLIDITRDTFSEDPLVAGLPFHSVVSSEPGLRTGSRAEDLVATRSSEDFDFHDDQLISDIYHRPVVRVLIHEMESWVTVYINVTIPTAAIDILGTEKYYEEYTGPIISYVGYIESLEPLTVSHYEYLGL